MAIPARPKREPRPVARTFKLSISNVEWLKHTSDRTNRSQADIIDYLITKERGAAKPQKVKK